MSIREYSMTRDSTRQLSPSFRVREFACKGSDVVLIDDELVVLLQCIREHFGKPVHITSGYRTAEHNAAVGGDSRYRHTFDVEVRCPAQQMLAGLAAAHGSVVGSGAVSAGDMHRLSEVLPDALEQHHKLVVEEHNIAAGAGKLADTEAG